MYIHIYIYIYIYVYIYTYIWTEGASAGAALDALRHAHPSNAEFKPATLCAFKSLYNKPSSLNPQLPTMDAHLVGATPDLSNPIPVLFL